MTQIDETLTERGNNYGRFSDHGLLSQSLKDAMRDHPRYITIDDDKKEALEMIQHKIARIINGNSDYKDSWTDIIGYATLIERELE